jgi:hypothetical protein
MVPDDANYSRWPRIRMADLQVVAFSMVGLFTLVQNLAYVTRAVGIYLGSLYSDSLGDYRVDFLEWLFLENTLASLVGCGIGLWLILGSRGLVRLIRRLRRPEFEETAETLVPPAGSPADTKIE